MRDVEAAAALFVAFLFLSRAAGASFAPSSTAPSSGLRDWTADEMRAFVAAVAPTGVNPAHALHVYASESNLDPAAMPRSQAAAGLMQAQRTLLKAAGWTDTVPAFARLGVAEQAPWIGKMLRLQIGGVGFVPRSALELYLVNLSPLAAKEGRDVIYRRDDPVEGPLYNGTKGLDVEGKGFINRADLARVLARVERNARLQRHLALLRRA
jgi:hypothetical protein